MENTDLVSKIPPLLSGDKLINALKDIPDYSDTIRNEDAATRLMQLSDVYRVYYPSPMSVEIYNKLYLATAMSLKKKNTRLSIMQKNSNFLTMQGRSEYRGIIGGSDSFTIIGTSGIGKSSAIERAVGLISGNGVIETQNPYTKIIPCIQVQCPFDASPKGMLLSILKSVDDVIGTEYYKKSQRQAITTDILIGTVSQVCTNHVGLLIIDEIQHVYGHKNGVTLINMITQLINTSGISICLVGTEESVAFFEKAPQLARRALGLKYGVLSYDAYFRNFCKLLFSYQYTKEKTEITETMIQWLYEYSGGVLSVIVSILHDANEIAIFNGAEKITMSILSEAYDKRISMLHNFISQKIIKNQNLERPKKKKVQIENVDVNIDIQEYVPIPELIIRAKDKGVDAIDYLKDFINIEEVQAE
jgi:hypothetical protein